MPRSCLGVLFPSESALSLKQEFSVSSLNVVGDEEGFGVTVGAMAH